MCIYLYEIDCNCDYICLENLLSFCDTMHEQIPKKNNLHESVSFHSRETFTMCNNTIDYFTKILTHLLNLDLLINITGPAR